MVIQPSVPTSAQLSVRNKGNISEGQTEIGISLKIKDSDGKGVPHWPFSINIGNQNVLKDSTDGNGAYRGVVIRSIVADIHDRLELVLENTGVVVVKNIPHKKNPAPSRKAKNEAAEREARLNKIHLEGGVIKAGETLELERGIYNITGPITVEPGGTLILKPNVLISFKSISVELGASLEIGAYSSITTDTIEIDDGGTLRIKEGTIIKFRKGQSLKCHGLFEAHGSPRMPIKFTCHDASCTEDSSSKSSVFWDGIIINGAGTAGSKMESCVVEYAQSQRNGGGLSVSGSPDFEITSSIIQKNKAPYGGGLLCSLSRVKITDVDFSDNSASIDGGGLYVLCSSVSIQDSSFRGNHAKVNGGAIYGCNNWYADEFGISPSDPRPYHLSLSRCIVANNTADQKGGGVAILNSRHGPSSNTQIDNVGFVDNTSNGDQNGNSCYVQMGPSDTLLIANSTFLLDRRGTSQVDYSNEVVDRYSADNAQHRRVLDIKSLPCTDNNTHILNVQCSQPASANNDTQTQQHALVPKPLNAHKEALSDIALDLRDLYFEKSPDGTFKIKDNILDYIARHCDLRPVRISNNIPFGQPSNEIRAKATTLLISLLSPHLKLNFLFFARRKYKTLAGYSEEEINEMVRVLSLVIPPDKAAFDWSIENQFFNPPKAPYPLDEKWRSGDCSLACLPGIDGREGFFVRKDLADPRNVNSYETAIKELQRRRKVEESSVAGQVQAAISELECLIARIEEVTGLNSLDAEKSFLREAKDVLEGPFDFNQIKSYVSRLKLLLNNSRINSLISGFIPKEQQRVSGIVNPFADILSDIGKSNRTLLVNFPDQDPRPAMDIPSFRMLASPYMMRHSRNRFMSKVLLEQSMLRDVDPSRESNLRVSTIGSSSNYLWGDGYFLSSVLVDTLVYRVGSRLTPASVRIFKPSTTEFDILTAIKENVLPMAALPILIDELHKMFITGKYQRPSTAESSTLPKGTLSQIGLLVLKLKRVKMLLDLTEAPNSGL